MATQPTEVGVETYGTGYLEERKLVCRWHPALSGFLTFLLAFVIFWVTWKIFFEPAGPMSLYTPMKAFQYITWVNAVVIIWALVFHFWPFHRRWLDTANPVAKALALGLASTAIAIFIIHVIFQGMVGHLGLAYFSPGQLYGTGLEGMLYFQVFEYAALAAAFLGIIMIWFVPAWSLNFESWPWKGLKQPALGFSVFSFGLLVSLVFFLFTAHNHLGLLSVRWELMNSICPAWWTSFAHTLSGYFFLALFLWWIAILFTYDLLWEKWPFREIKRAGIRRWGSFWAVVAIGVCIAFGLYFAQETYPAWGQAVQGARLRAGEHWRWMNIASMAGFWIAAMVFWKYFCGNWPTKFSAATNWIARTWIVVAMTAIFQAVYYTAICPILGLQTTMFHSYQFPLAPIFWLVIIMIIVAWFGDMWPGWKKVKGGGT